MQNRSKILHTWTFNLEGKSHKIEFWDSRLSGKKKLSLDDNKLIMTKDKDFFYYQFKIGNYTFNLNHYDTDTELLINDKKFKELMKEERSGILDKEKQDYLRKQKNKNKEQNKYVLAGENIYDIKEQKRLLEEFERKKKKEKENIKNFYIGNEQNISNNNQNKNKFILDDETVKKNRLIICNIENIFDSDNGDDEYNINDFTWDSNTYNINRINNNNINQKNENGQNRFELNTNINYNQINNNINNQHNQEVINQFFDFTQNKNNNNFNQNITNNFQNQNNKYDDDFNPFLDQNIKLILILQI